MEESHEWPFNSRILRTIHCLYVSDIDVSMLKDDTEDSQLSECGNGGEETVGGQK